MITKKSVKLELSIEDLIKAFGFNSSFQGFDASANLYTQDGKEINGVCLYVRGEKDNQNENKEAFITTTMTEGLPVELIETGDIISFTTKYENYSEDDPRLANNGIFLGKRVMDDITYFTVCYYVNEIKSWSVVTLPKRQFSDLFWKHKGILR